MTYTAEQLREESDQRKAEGQHYLALIFSGYADTLEENARLKDELAKLRQYWFTNAAADTEYAQEFAAHSRRADFPEEK